MDDGLKEWDYGVYEGKTTREIRAEVPAWSVWKNEIVGGETAEHVGERADGVIARALAAAPDGGKVALFAHAHILRILAARWIGLEAEEGGFVCAGDRKRECAGMGAGDARDQSWNRGFE